MLCCRTLCVLSSAMSQVCTMKLSQYLQLLSVFATAIPSGSKNWFEKHGYNKLPCAELVPDESCFRDESKCDNGKTSRIMFASHMKDSTLSGNLSGSSDTIDSVVVCKLSLQVVYSAGANLCISFPLNCSQWFSKISASANYHHTMSRRMLRIRARGRPQTIEVLLQEPI